MSNKILKLMVCSTLLSPTFVARAAYAEGSRSLGDGAFGVNRRVQLSTPNNERNLGIKHMEASFDCVFNIPWEPDAEPGQLRNKPSFYLGLRGPCRFWNPDVRSRTNPAINGDWVYDGTPRHIDAGLEYDNRDATRGWRAFISVDRIQTNLANADGTPWRGQQGQYKVEVDVETAGTIKLTVTPLTGSHSGHAKILRWSHSNSQTVADAVFSGDAQNGRGTTVPPFSTANNQMSFKKVVANTRPAARGEYLDGARINCTSYGTYVNYLWQGILRNGLGGEYVDYDYTNNGIRIDDAQTGYDTPYDGNRSWDMPGRGNVATANSRYKVDFYWLDGNYTSPPGISTPGTELYMIGRDQNSQRLKQSDWPGGPASSRYNRETVRINLANRIDGAGIVKFPKKRRFVP